MKWLVASACNKSITYVAQRPAMINVQMNKMKNKINNIAVKDLYKIVCKYGEEMMKGGNTVSALKFILKLL